MYRSEICVDKCNNLSRSNTTRLFYFSLIHGNKRDKKHVLICSLIAQTNAQIKLISVRFHSLTISNNLNNLVCNAVATNDYQNVLITDTPFVDETRDCEFENIVKRVTKRFENNRGL